jgi:hypothetical protein
MDQLHELVFSFAISHGFSRHEAGFTHPGDDRAGVLRFDRPEPGATPEGLE